MVAQNSEEQRYHSMFLTEQELYYQSPKGFMAAQRGRAESKIMHPLSNNEQKAMYNFASTDDLMKRTQEFVARDKFYDINYSSVEKK